MSGMRGGGGGLGGGEVVVDAEGATTAQTVGEKTEEERWGRWSHDEDEDMIVQKQGRQRASHSGVGGDGRGLLACPVSNPPSALSTLHAAWESTAARVSGSDGANQRPVYASVKRACSIPTTELPNTRPWPPSDLDTRCRQLQKRERERQRDRERTGMSCPRSPMTMRQARQGKTGQRGCLELQPRLWLVRAEGRL